MSGALVAALLSAALLGFRHGFDYDHIAAITDITSVQSEPRAAMRLGLLYALGHATTVAVLGTVVILFQLNLPARMDRIAERLVGLTLIALGLYVISCLVRRKHNHLGLSRVALALNGARWVGWKTRSVFRPDIPRPQAFRFQYDRRSAFIIGIIHGLGAETPTQIVVFLLAANLGGIGKGFLGLGLFIVGLLVMNTIMTASAAGIFRISFNRPAVLTFVMCLTAAYSLIIGVTFLAGASSLLPALGGG
ncbi:MAG: hypothetical protein ABI383_05950 [Acidobacteriaceae bacterium]